MVLYSAFGGRLLLISSPSVENLLMILLALNKILFALVTSEGGHGDFPDISVEFELVRDFLNILLLPVSMCDFERETADRM